MRHTDHTGWEKTRSGLHTDTHTLETLTLTIRKTIVTSRALIALSSSDAVSAGTLTAVRITKLTTAV